MKLPVCFVILAGLALAGPTGSAIAESAPTKDQLIKSLSGGGVVTRGFAPGADPAATRSLVDGVRSKATRQITVEERTELAKAADAMPQIDLEVNFAYDSAVIEQAALPTLVTLGQALSDKELKGGVFLVAGHTDAAGSAPYNQELSERRAEAVKAFLVETFKLEPESLIAVGYGKEQLKLPGEPLAGENRRVQVVNLAAQ